MRHPWIRGDEIRAASRQRVASLRWAPPDVRSMRSSACAGHPWQKLHRAPRYTYTAPTRPAERACTALQVHMPCYRIIHTCVSLSAARGTQAGPGCTEHVGTSACADSTTRIQSDRSSSPTWISQHSRARSARWSRRAQNVAAVVPAGRMLHTVCLASCVHRPESARGSQGPATRTALASLLAGAAVRLHASPIGLGSMQLHVTQHATGTWALAAAAVLGTPADPL